MNKQEKCFLAGATIMIALIIWAFCVHGQYASFPFCVVLSLVPAFLKRSGYFDEQPAMKSFVSGIGFLGVGFYKLLSAIPVRQ